MELFLAVIVDSCKSKCLFPIMTQGFCAYTVFTSLPVWTFPVRGQLGLTPLPLSTLFGVSQNYGVRTYTLTHTAFCSEHGPLFRCRFLLPRMQLCITTNVLKWPLLELAHSLFSFTRIAFTNMCLSPVISSPRCKEFCDLCTFRSQRVWGTYKVQLDTL